MAAPLNALDRLTLGYVGVATLALAAAWPLALPGRGLLAFAHVLLVVLVLLAPRARREGPAGQLLGAFYPLIVEIALYTEVGLLNGARGVSHDAVVQGWEAALFGGQPSRDWIRAQPWPWLSWPLHLGYLSYYLILAAAPLALWLRGQRDSARHTLFQMMLAFYACDAIFLLFPVAGPRYLFPLAHNAATATLPAVFAQRLLNEGAAWGTAFPSSHVAVALVASLSAGRAWRRLGVVLIPAAVVLACGTVYGQFHYAVDALAGAALAALVLLSTAKGSESDR
jgi:membrane-associated phospholipid phosphatase